MDPTWSAIPPHILVEIYSYLPPNDRLNVSLVCKDWSEGFHDSQLWNHFVFKFDSEKDPDAKNLVCADKYSHELKDVAVLLNQKQPKSRENAMYVLDKLIELSEWKLLRFRFGFTATNPLCFNGKTISDKLNSLLTSSKGKEVLFPLRVIDLSTLNISLEDSMLSVLSENHRQLRTVHIQNSCLIDNITAEGVLNLVNSCTQLEELYVFYHCVTDDVISALSAEGRYKVRTLSLMCNRSDKFVSFVSSDSWKSFTAANAGIELIMRFHSTMPRQLVIPILCPDIPVTEIDLHLYSWLHEEISHIAETCNRTLRSLSCHTSLDPNSQANAELPPALLELASKCAKLKFLHCHCKLPPSTITSIRSMRMLEKSTLYSEDVTEYV